MSRVHFVGGEKGGVGKSVVARVLAQYFIDRQIPFLGFDTDKSHGSLLRFYTDFAAPVVIDRYEGLDRIVEAATEQPDRRVIVDLAAQTYGFLTEWMEDSGLLDVSGELGLSVRYWHVMDAGRDSTDLLVKLLDRFGDRLPLVVVLNEVRGSDFGILESSGALVRAKELGAKVARLRQLQDLRRDRAPRTLTAKARQPSRRSASPRPTPTPRGTPTGRRPGAASPRSS
jgi:CobQ/CobB/MinD/ParA nucleotide binding domain